MPIYEESCRACGHVHEYYSPSFNDTTVPCPKCDGYADRCISVSVPKVFKAFSTRNIAPDGRELHIGSQRELSRYCHEFGVVPASDIGGGPPQTKLGFPEMETPKW